MLNKDETFYRHVSTACVYACYQIEYTLNGYAFNFMQALACNVYLGYYSVSDSSANSCHLLKQSRFGTKHKCTRQVVHMTGVLQGHILHFRLPKVLSPLRYVGKWESVAGTGCSCAGADAGAVPASSATSASRKAF